MTYTQSGHGDLSIHPSEHDGIIVSDCDSDDEFYFAVFENNYPPCRQNKLDEALLSSGRFSDAIQSLMEWLTKAEAYLSEDQPILGDLDTVNILIEQHKVRVDTY